MGSFLCLIMLLGLSQQWQWQEIKTMTQYSTI